MFSYWKCPRFLSVKIYTARGECKIAGTIFYCIEEQFELFLHQHKVESIINTNTSPECIFLISRVKRNRKNIFSVARSSYLSVLLYCTFLCMIHCQLGPSVTRVHPRRTPTKDMQIGCCLSPPRPLSPAKNFKKMWSSSDLPVVSLTPDDALVFDLDRVSPVADLQIGNPSAARKVAFKVCQIKGEMFSCTTGLLKAFLIASEKNIKC